MCVCVCVHTCRHACMHMGLRTHGSDPHARQDAAVSRPRTCLAVHHTSHSRAHTHTRTHTDALAHLVAHTETDTSHGRTHTESMVVQSCMTEGEDSSTERTARTATSKTATTATTATTTGTVQTPWWRTWLGASLIGGAVGRLAGHPFDTVRAMHMRFVRGRSSSYCARSCGRGAWWPALGKRARCATRGDNSNGREFVRCFADWVSLWCAGGLVLAHPVAHASVPDGGQACGTPGAALFLVTSSNVNGRLGATDGDAGGARALLAYMATGVAAELVSGVLYTPMEVCACVSVHLCTSRQLMCDAGGEAAFAGRRDERCCTCKRNGVGNTAGCTARARHGRLLSRLSRQRGRVCAAVGRVLCRVRHAAPAIQRGCRGGRPCGGWHCMYGHGKNVRASVLSLAPSCAAAVTTPLDVFKTRWQVRAGSARSLRQVARAVMIGAHCCVELWRGRRVLRGKSMRTEHGWAGLFGGVVPRTLWVAATMSSSLAVVGQWMRERPRTDADADAMSADALSSASPR
jgi:hypothetical protein